MDNNDKAQLAKKLAYFAKKGYSIEETVRNIRYDFKDPIMKASLEKLLPLLESGKPFWKSLEAAPPIFSKSIMELIKAGELMEDLPGTLSDVSELLNEENKVKSTIKSSFRKVVIPLNFLVIFFLGLFIVIINNFAVILFNQTSGNLPLVTILLIKLSGIINTPIFYFSVLFITGGVNTLLLCPDPVNNRFLFYMPIAGKIIRKYHAYLIARVSAKFLEKGVTIDKAFVYLLEDYHIPAAAYDINLLKNELQKGMSFSQAASNTKYLPRMFKWLFKNLDNENNLVNFLTSSASVFKTELLSLEHSAGMAAQSTMVIVIIICVVISIFSFFLPMYSLIGKLQ